MAGFFLNMTRLALSINGSVLNFTVFVLNVTVFVKIMTVPLMT